MPQRHARLRDFAMGFSGRTKRLADEAAEPRGVSAPGPVEFRKGEQSRSQGHAPDEATLGGNGFVGEGASNHIYRKDSEQGSEGGKVQADLAEETPGRRSRPDNWIEILVGCSNA